MRKSVLSATALWILIVLSASSCDFLTPTEEESLIPTGISLATGGGQVGEVGEELRGLVRVKVVDEGGAPVPGVRVEWAVQSGGPNAAVTPTSETSGPFGHAQAAWRMGETAGSQSVQVTLPEYPAAAALVVTATAEPGPVAALTPSQTTLTLGALDETASLTTTAADRFGNAVTGYVAEWTTDNGTIATVSSSGVVKARGNGTTTIHATADVAGAQVAVTVQQVPASLRVMESSVALDAVGDTLRLGTAVADANLYPIDAATATWTSTDAGVVSVSAQGLVTAEAAGSALVIATLGALTDTVRVSVVQKAATLTITPAADTLAIDSATVFTAEAADGNGNAVSTPALTWSSLDPHIASVDSAGGATALKPGTARIRVTSGTAADTAWLVVLAPAISFVDVSPETVDLQATGDTARLTAAAFDADSVEITAATILWSSANTSIATVNGTGLVTARGEGTTWIRVSSGGLSDSTRIRSGTATLPDSIAVIPDSVTFAALGQTATLDVTVYNMDREPISAELTWSVTDTAVVAMDGGAVVAVGPGLASVIATAESVSDTVYVTVKQELVDLAVSPVSDSVVLDGTARFTARGFDANANEIADLTFGWTSLNTTVATVDQSGLATGLVAGSAQIEVVSGIFADTATLVVLDITVDSVVVTPQTDTLFTVGDTTALTAEAYDSTGTLITLEVAYSWSSSNTGVATVVGDGVVTARGGGEAWVYAAAGSASDSSLIVVELTVASITLSPDSLHFTGIGDSIPVSAELRDGNGNVITQGVDWAIADTTVARLEGQTVISVADGTTTLTASSGGATKVAPVVVALAADSVWIQPDTLSLSAVGVTGTFTAQAYDNVGQPLSAPTFTWTSADTAIATVDASGTVTSRALGGTWIYASADAAVDSAWVDIVQQPASIVMVSGNAQDGSAGQPLPDSLVVQVLDGAGGAVFGAQVLWTTASGSLSPDTTTTDAQGQAWARWTMPNDAGSFNATATVADSLFVTFQAGVGSLPGDVACSNAGVVHDSTVTANETWLASASPHHVNVSLGVTGTATLTIEPGALLCFGRAAGLYTLEQGSIDARGTATDSIIMVATNRAEPWDGLRFRTSTTDTSWLAFARIDDANWGGTIDAQGAYTILAEDLNIRYSSLVVLHGNGSRLVRSTVQPTVNNAAIDSRGVGSLIQDVVVLNAPNRAVNVTGDSTRLENLSVQNAGTEGLWINASTRGVVLDSVYIENSGAIGINIPTGALASATGVRVVGSGSYGANIGLDILAILAPLPSDQDSLMGNTVDTLLISGGSIYSDTVYARADLPWRIDNSATVDTLSQLKALPGARLAFDPYTQINFYNGGHLDAQGTADSVIVFTSTDEPTLAEPVPEYWYGFNFNGVSWAPATSIVRHALLEHTQGNAIYAADYHSLVLEDARLRQGGGLDVREAGTQIRRVVVDSARHASRGLFVYDADSTVVEDLTVRATPGEGVYVYNSRGTSLTNVWIEGSGTTGLYLSGAEPVTLSNVDVVNSGGTGMYAQSGSVESSTGLRVQGSAGYGVDLGFDVLARVAATVALQDSLMGNGLDTLVVNGGSIYYDTVYVRPDLPWRVNGGLTVDTLSHLKVLPGSGMAFNPYTQINFSHGGNLDAQGTADSVIVFTSTDKPTTSEPVPEYWYGFNFNGVSWAPATSLVRHALLEHTQGNAIYAADFHTLVLEDARLRQGGGLDVREAGTQIRRVVVDSARHASRGLFVFDADSTVVEDLTVRATPGEGVYVYNSRGTSLTNVWIEGSGTTGLYLSGAEPVTLSNVDVVNSGGTGMYAQSGSVESSTGLRVQGSAGYGVDLGFDVLARVAATVALQDSLMGNGLDTLVVNGGSIYFDTVYVRPDLPWRVNGGLTVDTMSHLKVLPGAGMAFNPYTQINFSHGGNLDAQGTADSVIVFTSTDEPTIAEPVPEYWYGFNFNGVSWAPATSLVRHALLEHTQGNAIYAADYHSLVLEDARLRQGGGLDVREAGTQIRRVVVDSARHASRGLFVFDADSTVVEDLTVRATPGEGVYVYNSRGTTLTNVWIEGSGTTGLYLSGAEPVTLSNVDVVNSGGTGMYAQSGSVESSTGLRVQGSAGYGVDLGFDVLARIAPTMALQDSLMGNGLDTLVVNGGSIYFDTVQAGPNLPWRVTGSLTVDSLSYLDVYPGADFRFNAWTGLTFHNGGTLDAQGTPASRVVFTTADVPTLSQPTPDPWYGLTFYGSTWAGGVESYLSNVEITYAAAGSFGLYAQSGRHSIYMDSSRIAHSAQVRIGNGSSFYYNAVDSAAVGTTAHAVALYADSDTTNGSHIDFGYNTVRYSGGHGLYVDEYHTTGYGTTISVYDSEISGNASNGIEAQDIITILNSNVRDNGGFGLYYAGTGTFIAENIWWGDSGGPTGTNGDGVSAPSGAIDYDPWLGAEYTITGNPWWP